MSGRRVHRISRLEVAATARIVHGIARRYALTDEETTELMHDTQQALIRWRAGLPLETDGAIRGGPGRSGNDAAL